MARDEQSASKIPREIVTNIQEFVEMIENIFKSG